MSTSSSCSLYSLPVSIFCLTSLSLQAFSIFLELPSHKQQVNGRPAGFGELFHGSWEGLPRQVTILLHHPLYVPLVAYAMCIYLYQYPYIHPLCSYFISTFICLCVPPVSTLSLFLTLAHFTCTHIHFLILNFKGTLEGVGKRKHKRKEQPRLFPKIIIIFGMLN